MEPSSNKKIVFVLIAVICALFLLVLFLIAIQKVLLDKPVQQTTTEQVDTTTKVSEDLRELYFSQDIDGITSEVGTYIHSMNEDTQEEANLQFAYAVNLIQHGTQEQKGEAIALLRGIAEDMGIDSRVRAIAVNYLIWAAYLDMAQFQADVFPFYIESSDAMSNEMYRSVKEASVGNTVVAVESRYLLTKYLAEFSLTLEPTPFAAQFLANWYTDIVAGVPYKVNSENLSEEELVARAVEYIQRADMYQENEQNVSYNLRNSSNISYYYWKGKILGDLAVLGYDPGQSFEDAFNQALSIQVGINNLYVDYTPHIHFYYAAYIQSLSPVERAADVQQHVDALNLSLDQASADTTTNFTRFVQTSAGGDGAVPTAKINYLKAVAAVSPEFEQYLSAQGIEL